jgi:hypothetical protein
MDAAGSESEFIKAAREFQSIIRKGVERARTAQSGIAPSAPKIEQPAIPKNRLRYDAQGNLIP